VPPWLKILHTSQSQNPGLSMLAVDTAMRGLFFQ
jgi:hypothetical protein